MVTKRRGLVLVLALAGIAAGLIASWPASATNARSAAAPKTVNKFFFHDGPDPISDSGGQIASVALPKGSWVVTAKLWVDHASSSPDIFVGCNMGLGSGPTADGDAAAFVSPAKADGVVAGTIVMSASHTFAAAGTVTVSCNDLGTNAQYHNLRIEAVRVASITRTQI